MKILNLNILERLMAMTLLPKEGDLVFWKIARGLKEKLGFTYEEITAYELVTSDGMTTWNSEKVKEKEIELNDVEEKVLLDGILRLDKEKKITENYLSLAEKLVPAS